MYPDSSTNWEDRTEELTDVLLRRLRCRIQPCFKMAVHYGMARMEVQCEEDGRSAYPPRAAPEEPSPTRPQFQSALNLVHKVVGTDRRLTLELVRSYDRVCQWRERWGFSPPGSDPFESPPHYSPRLDEPFPNIASHPSSDRSLSPIPALILNPPIPGDPAPSSEVLFESTNSFVKANGFGIVRRNAYSYKGRKIRYSFQCDRFGDPTPSRGAGLR
ncbi:hypothetical protein ACJZ2D_007836 [Fusarium nematophilum]